MTEEEKDAAKEENIAIQVERDAACAAIADVVSCFKRDYIGSPILAGIEVAINGGNFAPAEIPYRADEKYYVFAKEGELTVVWGLNFKTDIEQVIGRIFTIELKEKNGVV